MVRWETAHTVPGQPPFVLGTRGGGRTLAHPRGARSRIVGGGRRFFPHGVRLDLELLDECPFDGGVLVVRYGVRGSA